MFEFQSIETKNLNPNRQSGFGAFAYILMSIALLAALTSALSLIGRNNTNAANNDIQISKIYGQASKIRADILLCMTETQSQNSGTGPTAYRRFPGCSANANGGSSSNGTYTAPGFCSNASSTVNDIIANARNLRCLTPSSPSVWDNTEGNFFPDKITGYEEWKYVVKASNPYQGVSLMITAENRASSADINFVLQRVRDRFGPNEAQLLTRAVGAPGDNVDMSGVTVCDQTTTNCNTLQVRLAR